MSTTRKLQPAQWREFFDWLTQHFPSLRTTVEVTAIDLGDQIEVDAVLLDGLSYDPDNREVVVLATLDNIEHHISDPQEIYLLEDDGVPSALQIIDGVGRKQIMRFTPLQQLPAPPVW